MEKRKKINELRDKIKDKAKQIETLNREKVEKVKVAVLEAQEKQEDK